MYLKDYLLEFLNSGTKVCLKELRFNGQSFFFSS